MNEYEELKKNGWSGFAQKYLAKTSQIKSEAESLEDEIDLQIYIELVGLDSKLGTAASGQLSWCLFYTMRSDIIKVLVFDLSQVV